MPKAFKTLNNVLEYLSISTVQTLVRDRYSIKERNLFTILLQIFTVGLNRY